MVLARTGEHVGDDAGRRRHDMALIDPPLRHDDRRAQGFHELQLRLDLALSSHRGAHLRQRGFEPLHPGKGGTQVGALVFDQLLRHASVLYQLLVALEVGLELVAGRVGIGQVGFGLLDFGRLAAGLKVGKLLLGLLELACGLVMGRPVVGVVLVE
jgi:hypothetical protein